MNYSIGDTVALTNKLERCGIIIQVDEKGSGYKVDTGKDIIYFYEKDIESIEPKPVNLAKVSDKIDHCTSVDPVIKQAILDFIQTGTKVALTFADYILKVHSNVVSGLIDKIEVKVNINVNINVGSLINVNSNNSFNSIKD